MATSHTWMLVALLGFAIAVSGCVYNDNDDNDDGGDGGVSGTVGGDNNENNDGDDGATVSARGSPGWGFLGVVATLAGVGILLRRT